MKPLAPTAVTLQHVRPTATLRSSNQPRCALPKTKARVDWHSHTVPHKQVINRHTVHDASSTAYKARWHKAMCCHSPMCSEIVIMTGLKFRFQHHQMQALHMHHATGGCPADVTLCQGRKELKQVHCLIAGFQIKCVALQHGMH